MKFINVNNINAKVEDDTIRFIQSSEQEYVSQLKEVAKHVIKHAEHKPIVLISGPSGSGKTTSALKLSQILLEDYNRTSGVVSLDNYFKSNDEYDMPKNEDGSIDLESPLCVDIPLLKSNIQDISNGKSFNMPYFNFVTQRRGGYKPFTVNTGDIVIFEGIHALNPMVTGDFDCTTKVYISVRTRLVNDDGSVLHPRRIRLMRRLLRDSLFRGKDYNYIFSYFKSVSHGEDKYIMPFKQFSEFDIDTFHNYEASVYKSYLLNNLIEAKDTLKGNLEYEEIVSFLSELDDIDSNLVPNNSLVREFIGGSSFSY